MNDLPKNLTINLTVPKIKVCSLLCDVNLWGFPEKREFILKSLLMEYQFILKVKLVNF